MYVSDFYLNCGKIHVANNDDAGWELYWRVLETAFMSVFNNKLNI